jgi:hypothetical protein
VRLSHGGLGLLRIASTSLISAARYWIEAGDVGVVTFDACCAWLGWDAECTRGAIFSAALAA